MGKAGKSIQGFGAKVAEVASGLAAYDLAKSAVGKLQELTLGAMDHIDATTKLAQSLGVTTESLSKLQYAAGQSGVESEQLTVALGKMTKILGEAQAGGKSANAAISAL